jgi:hypothetical protein
VTLPRTCPPRSTAALLRTQERLRALRPEFPGACTVRVGVPDDLGWLGLDALTAEKIACWWSGWMRRDSTGGRGAVAAVRVVGGLAHAVLGRLTAGLVLDRRAYDIRAANLAVHHDDAGQLDAVAVRRPTLAVLPDDDAAGAADVVVAPDLLSMLDEPARHAVAILGPVIDELRALSRFGVVPAWNVVADSVLSTATFVPLFAGGDERAGRVLGEALLDALVRYGARIRTRGTCTSARGLRLPVRGSCCFHYRTDPQVKTHDDAFCTTCPLLDPTVRSRRFQAFLDEEILPRRRAGVVARRPRPEPGSDVVQP